ncbi:YybH family protein, partial [Tahibacter caeni]|uniref:YybH family protein n=1 Tax=Tahibacter caeni TaxID=1453545 RepID=UPI0021494710
AGEPAAADRAALEQLVTRADAAWNSRDAAALAGLYVADGTLRVGSASATVEGAAAIRRYFTESFARVEPQMRHETTLVGLHAINEDVVLADTSVELVRVAADGSRTVVRRFATPTIAVRSGGDWRIGAARAQVIPEAKTDKPAGT